MIQRPGNEERSPRAPEPSATAARVQREAQMKTRMGVAAAILTGIIAAGGGGAAFASSGTTSITHATSSTKAMVARAPRYVVLNCSFKPVMEPSTFTIA